MGVQQSKSKGELLYQQVNYGNVLAVKALHGDGASLEWVDGEGRTPLVVACLKPCGVHVAQVLLELGADVNAYRPGSHAGTPLHHAAERGFGKTVSLLLSYGANARRLNDDGQTALDLARQRGHMNVVRTIESHIALFSGWLRELHGPSSISAMDSQLLSRNIMAVVLPCDHLSPFIPVKLELVIYPETQQFSDGGREVRHQRRRRRRKCRKMDRKIAKSCISISLWNAKIEEPDFNQLDPVVKIFNGTSGTEYRFSSAQEGDKQQLLQFYNVCKDMSQVSTSPAMSSRFLPNPGPSASAPPSSLEDLDLIMAINALVQSTMAVENTNVNNKDLGADEPLPSSSSAIPINVDSAFAVCEDSSPMISTPSPASLGGETSIDNVVHYPVIDSSLVINPLGDDHIHGSDQTSEAKVDGVVSRSCVVCLDAVVEGACVPCGHMAGCMNCLNDVKAKGWGCPICRAGIDQVVKIFSV